MAKHPKRPRDLNQLAKAIVDLATSAEEDRPIVPPAKDPAAADLGRRGGLKGGKVRAEALTPERRSEIAQRTAAARYANKG